MRHSWGKRVGAALVAGVATAALAAVLLASRPSDRAQLERLVSQVEQGFEAKTAKAVMDSVASDYHDAEGLDRGDVSRIVRRLAGGAHSVDITVRSQQLQVAGDRATGHFDVRAVVTEGEERIRWPMRLDVQFARRPSAWWRPWHRRWVVTSVEGHNVSALLEGI